MSRRQRIQYQRRSMAMVAVTATALAGCGNAQATAPAGSSGARVASLTVTAAQRHAIDRYTTIARARYDKEVSGVSVHTQLRRVGSDAVLLRDLRSGNTSALRGYVTSQFRQVWYHWHVSRMRIVQGNKTLVEVGVPFALATSQRRLRDAHGRAIATLVISVQDEVGIVKAMHRHYPVDVVIRGAQAGHVVTLLPAAAHATLPARGTTIVAGHRYLVRSFQRRAFGGEPVTVWLLMRG